MHEDIKWLFGLLIVFGMAWFVSGNYNRATSKQPFIKPLIGTSAPETYGTDVIHIGSGSKTSSASSRYATGQASQKPANVQEITKAIKDAGVQADKIQAELTALQAAQDASALTGKLTMAGVTRNINPAAEYVTLKSSAKNTAPILITGLRLTSAPTGNSVEIGEAATLPFQNQINVENPVYLAPGQTAYVVSGRSPIGYSFRLNKCTGYFNQNQKFTPALPSKCPAPKNEPPPQLGQKNMDACLDYINSIPSCKTIISPPLNMSPECQQFVSMQYNYTKCVERHKNDPDFYDQTWMIYVNQTSPLWKSKRELIHLVDQSGRIVDAITY